MFFFFSFFFSLQFLFYHQDVKWRDMTYVHSFNVLYYYLWASQVAQWLKKKNKPTCQCRRCGFDPWVGKIPWRRKWQPTPIFLPGKFHGQESLEGYSPWGHKRFGHNKTIIICVFLINKNFIWINQFHSYYQRSFIFSIILSFCKAFCLPKFYLPFNSNPIL